MSTDEMSEEQFIKYLGSLADTEASYAASIVTELEVN